MNPENKCYCSQPIKNQLFLVCFLCHSKSHQSCYLNFEPPFTCILCQAEILEPCFNLTLISGVKSVQKSPRLGGTQEEAISFNFEKTVGGEKDQVFLFFLNKRTGKSFFDNSKSFADIAINDSRLKEKPYGRRSGVYIKDYLLQDSLNHVKVVFNKEGLSQGPFILFVVYGRRKKLLVLMKVIMKRARILLPAESFRLFTQRNNASHGLNDSQQEIVLQRPKVSVLDPMTMGNLTIACRGTNCTHVSCFSLDSYLKTNKNFKSAKRWVCPICSKDAYWKDLYFDEDLQDMISVSKLSMPSCLGFLSCMEIK